MARSDVLCCTSVSDGEGSRKVDSAMGAIGSIKRLHRLSERKPKPAGCPVPHSHRCIQCSLVFLQFLFISEFFYFMHYWRTGLGLIFGRRKNYTIMGKTKTQEWLS